MRGLSRAKLAVWASILGSPKRRIVIQWRHRGRFPMRPKQTRQSGSGDLFRSRLDQIIDMKHALVRLAGKIDWEWIDAELADRFSDKGRSATEARFMVGLLILKHMFALSDEGVCERWVYDPYFPYFTGAEFFQHAFPHERSGLTHWRSRIGDKLDMLLQESLRVAHDSGALKKDDLARITVDTTVQPKNMTHPTEAKLMLKAIEQLGALAKRHGVELRQSYTRVAKRAALMAGRYIHAKQFRRANRELRFQRTRLGRLSRDIARKTRGNPALRAVFDAPLRKAHQIRWQRQQAPAAKLYSWHAPETQCIGKGKAHKPYEFGVKVSIATTNRRAKGGQFVVHAKALPGNPYDGHTLAEVIAETEALTGCAVERAYVDKAIAATPCPIRAACSSPARNAASSASSSANSDAARPSKP